MDFKALNEQLKTLLETGFAVSGQRDEVNDILTKLTQEYGDLTIPEFIDKLIQAEQKGEEILKESLNEGYRFNSSDIDYLSYSDSKDWDSKEINTNYKNINVIPTGWQTVNNRYDITIENKYSKEKADIYISLSFEQKNETVNEWLGILGINITNRGESQKIKEFLKENTEQLGGIEFNSSTTYDCKFGRTLSKRTQESNSEAKTELLGKFNELLAKLDASLQTHANSFDNELEELEKARREARANRNVNNTTVKQALSKSAVAKKIRELQNPTPEQLARILAAIEG